MLHSIISLTTELKAAHLNLVILICIWVSCIYVPLVSARRWDEWRTLQSWIRSSFPWLRSEPRLVRGGAAAARCGRQVARPARSHGAERQRAPGAACGEPRCLPRSLLSLLGSALTPGSCGDGWCCSCSRDIACPLTHLAPFSVYITHSASSRVDWGVNDSGLFVC